MGRVKQYSTPAERQAAYRRRMKETTIWVNRDPFLRMEHAGQTLYQLLHRAAAQHHRLAHELLRSTPEDTLVALVEWLPTFLQEHKAKEDIAVKGNDLRITNKEANQRKN